MVLCGWDEVYILRFEGPDDSEPRKVWSWRADKAPVAGLDLGRFATTVDAAGEGGKRIVITSSSSGIAVVDAPPAVQHSGLLRLMRTRPRFYPETFWPWRSVTSRMAAATG